ncbi:MAG: hypothetical protein OIN66_17480 [Candidatus Methanoperedens sp.]|nr:hypothetical protein [Candidatus Methanoperedens sp.]
MLDLSFQNILEIYAWTAAGLIMIFMTAIAKFYQKKFGIKTFYYFYPLPIVVLFTAAFHLFSYRTSLSESIELIGSVGSFLVSFFLYRLMVGVK